MLAQLSTCTGPRPTFYLLAQDHGLPFIYLHSTTAYLFCLTHRKPRSGRMPSCLGTTRSTTALPNRSSSAKPSRLRICAFCSQGGRCPRCCPQSRRRARTETTTRTSPNPTCLFCSRLSAHGRAIATLLRCPTRPMRTCSARSVYRIFDYSLSKSLRRPCFLTSVGRGNPKCFRFIGF